MPLKELSAEEKARPYAYLYEKDMAPVPPEILSKIDRGPLDPGRCLALQDINRLLEPGYLEEEVGYCIMPDGSGHAAMRTDMPGVTGEMIDWWFTWHASEDLRYMIWYPGDHLGISVDDIDRLRDESLSYKERYLYNTNYPVEDVGSGIERLTITFVSPDEFGFNTADFEKAGVATVICAKVGYVFPRMLHTRMVHFVRKTDTGVEMRSRFWLAHRVALRPFSEKALINRLINHRKMKGLIMKERIARSMALHCAREYHNLAAILPALYREFR